MINETTYLDTKDLGRVQFTVFDDTDAPSSDGFPLGVCQLRDGTQTDTPPLVRLHSTCLFSQAFGSVHCECREQLQGAIDAIKREGAGIIIHLEQEGRGIGLLNKLKAYKAQNELGMDTVEAQDAIGVGHDERTYDGAARALTELGITSVRLMTNNPDKVAALEKHGISVQRSPLIIEVTGRADRYVQTKKEKLGHIL